MVNPVMCIIHQMSLLTSLLKFSLNTVLGRKKEKYLVTEFKTKEWIQLLKQISQFIFLKKFQKPCQKSFEMGWRIKRFFFLVSYSCYKQKELMKRFQHFYLLLILHFCKKASLRLCRR